MTPVAFTGSAVRPAQEGLPRTAVRLRGRNRVPTRTAPAGASAHRGTAPAGRGEGGGRSALPRRAAAPTADAGGQVPRATGVPPPGPARSGTGADTTVPAHERRIVRPAASEPPGREIADRPPVPPRTAASHRYETFPRPGAGSPGELRHALRRGGDPR
ncbi:hypothetical protein [Streptomyces glaucus]|uniref:Secreted protein n=1 Tax=Streptomyces glaucus TaxID=284029 RepID=A0ABN3KJJ2_9ACTN